MSETFSFHESMIYLWTGTATASAAPDYAKHVQGTFIYGWENFPTLDGVWHNVLTGQRADISIGTLYTVDNSALRTLADSQTGIHMHLAHTALGASAGYLLYSGRIDQVLLAGNDNQIYKYNVTYHANEWSAYG
jgi:hypothetical protein